MLATILSSKCSPAPTTYACIQCTRWQNARRLRARTHDCILCSMMSLLKSLSLQSGKSVYLKQVALIVYLAHLGSWVPAHSCQVSCLFWIGIRCLPPRARFACVCAVCMCVVCARARACVCACVCACVRARTYSHTTLEEGTCEGYEVPCCCAT